ncbi:MAG: hypothetical protein NTV70_13060 [Acidobacteria bacterium]|nr:hypothetical protein [Acidobacteriota bacterium]
MRVLLLVLLSAFAAYPQAGQTNPGGQGGRGTAGFGGPAVLGRAAGGGLNRSPEVKLRFFASVQANYDTGLTSLALDASGKPLTQSGSGMQATVGVTGTKMFRRSQVSLAFNGGYRHVQSINVSSGFNAIGIIGANHVLSRRASLSSSNAMGSQVQSFSLALATIPALALDPVTSSLPINDLIDTRISFWSNNSTLTYMLGPRLSVSASGGFNGNKRTGRALASSTGVSARGDIAYRLGRNQTISGDYSFTTYDFSNSYGNTAIHQVALAYSLSIGRAWKLDLKGGGALLQNEGLRQVRLDPFIAAILGQPSGVEAFYRENYLPSVQVNLTRTFGRSSITGTYQRGITPGNGILLTSRNTGYSGSYRYTGIRNWTLGALASNNQLDNLLSFQASSTIQSVLGSVGYRLRRDLQVNGTAGYRGNSLSTGTAFNQRGMRLTLNISYSPGDVPLALW